MDEVDGDEVESLRRQLKEALILITDLRAEKVHWKMMHARLSDAVRQVVLKTDRYTDAMLDHSAHQRSNPAGVDEGGELLAKLSDGSAAALIDIATALRAALEA